MDVAAGLLFHSSGSVVQVRALLSRVLRVQGTKPAPTSAAVLSSSQCWRTTGGVLGFLWVLGRVPQVLDLYTGALQRLLRGHMDTISGLCYHPSLQVIQRRSSVHGVSPCCHAGSLH